MASPRVGNALDALLAKLLGAKAPRVLVESPLALRVAALYVGFHAARQLERQACEAAGAAEEDGIASVYVAPLLVTMLGTYLFYMAIGIWLMRYELIRMRLRSLRRKQAAAHAFLAEATDT